MKIIKGTTKRGQMLIEKAGRFEGTKLDDVYGRYSEAKKEAMEDCERWCKEDDGFNFHIISHCTNTFSVAWNYFNKETGELMTRIETAQSTYIVDGSRREVE